MKRRNSDEARRSQEREADLYLDRSQIPRIASDRARRGLSPYYGPTERVIALLERAYDREPGPVFLERTQRDVREGAMALDVCSIARLLAWPLAPDDAELRPFAWDEIGDRLCALVHRTGDTITLGIAPYDPASPWVLAWRERVMRDRAGDEEAVAEFRERLLSLGPPANPGTSWAELAFPWDERPSAEAVANERFYWERDRRRAFHGERPPALVRWSSTAAEDRVTLTIDEARFVIENVLGVDVSSYEDVTTKVLRSEQVGDEARTLTPRWIATWTCDRFRSPPWWTHFELLQGICPPPTHGDQPYNATGQGWAMWAADRFRYLLQSRQVEGKRLEAIAASGITSIDRQDDFDFRNMIQNVTPRDRQCGHYSVFVALRGSVSGRGRRSRWERFGEKSIAVEFLFPLEMVPTRDRLHDTVVDANGLAYLTMGYGDYRSYAKEHDHAEWKLMGIERLVKKVIQDFFPGMQIREKWVW